jgi:hypothetical protein
MENGQTGIVTSTSAGNRKLIEILVNSMRWIRSGQISI